MTLVRVLPAEKYDRIMAMRAKQGSTSVPSSHQHSMMPGMNMQGIAHQEDRNE